MMSANRFPLYWRTNDAWYDYDENDQPYLTKEAPELAKKSFKEYMELQKQYFLGIGCLC